MPKAIEAVKISKTYGSGDTAVQALTDVDFAVEPGEFVTIMGPSGSGKSTLLALLGGLDSVDIGEVIVGGRSLSGMTESESAVLRRERIGFIFQSFNLLPVLTAAENVALPLLLAGQRGATVETQVGRMLAEVGLNDRSNHHPTELSGGQQQRVAIARALVAKPAIVLADEPTGNLDSRSSEEVLRILRNATDRLGQTVVLITHDPIVGAWANRVVFLRDGRVAGELKLEGMDASGPSYPRASAVRQHYDRAIGGGV